MAIANINDRTSIELIYPPDAFALDASDNDRQPGNDIRHGVRIVSAPDPQGRFELERASRQIGEAGGALFLAPFRRDPAGGEPAAGYDAFVDEIIAAAPCFGFRKETSPGLGDPRLHGLRQ